MTRDFDLVAVGSKERMAVAGFPWGDALGWVVDP